MTNAKSTTFHGQNVGEYGAMKYDLIYARALRNSYSYCALHAQCLRTRGPGGAGGQGTFPGIPYRTVYLICTIT